MAFIGGNRAQVKGYGLEEVQKLLTDAIKAAQKPAGLFVPPSTYNMSQYGATGDWVTEEGDRGTTVKLPAFKFTIKKGHTETLTLTIKDPDFRVWSVAGVLHSHAQAYRPGYYAIADAFVQPRRMPVHSDEWNRVESGIQTIAASYNYDKSDLMTDYFNSGFSLSVRPDPKLAEGNTQRAERIISELEIAFPDSWAQIVAEAAGEAQWVFHSPDSQIGTDRRDELDRAIRRAEEGVASGFARVPFRPDRPGSGWRAANSSNIGRYYRRERKLKGKGGGEVVARVAFQPGQAIVRGAPPKSSNAYPWLVERLSKYDHRGGYENYEIVAEGETPDLETAINDAESAMEGVR